MPLIPNLIIVVVTKTGLQRKVTNVRDSFRHPFDRARQLASTNEQLIGKRRRAVVKSKVDSSGAALGIFNDRRCDAVADPAHRGIVDSFFLKRHPGYFVVDIADVTDTQEVHVTLRWSRRFVHFGLVLVRLLLFLYGLQ